MSFDKLGNFWAVIFSNNFLVLPSLSSTSGTLMIWTVALLTFFHSSLSLYFFFLEVYFFSVKIERSVFKLTNSVHCHLCPTMRLFCEFWYLIVVVFCCCCCIISIFLNFYFFAEVFYFLFVSWKFFITSGSIVMMAALKSLSGNFNLWFILMLVSICCYPFLT